LADRYPNIRIEDFDGNALSVTEMDALVAYLQMLGTLVDFTTYDAEANYR
jgi:cytochrome c oxidase cbb3-type subunit II